MYKTPKKLLKLSFGYLGLHQHEFYFNWLMTSAPMGTEKKNFPIKNSEKKPWLADELQVQLTQINVDSVCHEGARLVINNQCSHSMKMFKTSINVILWYHNDLCWIRTQRLTVTLLEMLVKTNFSHLWSLEVYTFLKGGNFEFYFLGYLINEKWLSTNSKTKHNKKKT